MDALYQSVIQIFVGAADFWQKLALLVIVALLTGTLVPRIKRRIDEETFKRQKKYEAELALQGKIFEARARLLEDLAKVLWEYQLICLEVAYYKIDYPDEERYRKAVEKYHEKCWALLATARIETSVAKRLISEDTHREVTAFVGYLYGMDNNLAKLIKGEAADEDWKGYREKVDNEWRCGTEGILERLTKEIKDDALRPGGLSPVAPPNALPRARQ